MPCAFWEGGRQGDSVALNKLPTDTELLLCQSDNSARHWLYYVIRKYLTLHPNIGCIHYGIEHEQMET